MWSKAEPFTRDEVREAAVAIAFERGLHAVTAGAIAERLRVKPAAITAVEPSEDELVAWVFRRVVAAELAEVKRVILRHPSPTEQLRALFATQSGPVAVEVTAVWLESWSLGRRNRPLAAAVRQESESWQHFVVDLIRRGVARGEFMTVDADLVAAKIIGMIDGVNPYVLVDYLPDMDRARLLTSVARNDLGIELDEQTASEHQDSATRA